MENGEGSAPPHLIFVRLLAGVVLAQLTIHGIVANTLFHARPSGVFCDLDIGLGSAWSVLNELHATTLKFVRIRDPVLLAVAVRFRFPIDHSLADDFF